MLKTLEKKGLIERHRSSEDERVMVVTVTDQGMELREQAVQIPALMGSCMSLTMEEAQQLYTLLYKVLGGL